MKSILMIGKITKEGRSQVVNLAAARKMMFAEAAKSPTGSGRLQVRQMDRIHARTGVPWSVIYGEAKKEGL